LVNLSEERKGVCALIGRSEDGIAASKGDKPPAAEGSLEGRDQRPVDVCTTEGRGSRGVKIEDTEPSSIVPKLVGDRVAGDVRPLDVLALRDDLCGESGLFR
jgi:hypothetical protein